MQRLRASVASLHPGDAGAPPGVTTDPCQELADAMRSFRRMEAKRGPASNKRCHRQVPDGASVSGAARREAAVRCKPRSIKERPCACRRAVSPLLTLGCPWHREIDPPWLFDS